MLLSIDPKKIEDQLAAFPPAYIVAACNIDPEKILRDLPTADVYSMTPALPPDSERARERVLNLRQLLIDGGSRPLSPDDLDLKIDEIRGRR
jgi:hypothetical protein